MKLFNTLTRSNEDFKPSQDSVVKLYTCGLTVYSQPHVGNWLGYIYWDVLVRTLQADGYEVERTQNITDVGHLTSDDDGGEDKMEKGAKREGVTAWDVAEKYIAIADKEAAMLGLLPPTHLVRATAMIDQQIAFARQLDEKGFLYRIDGDGMFFDTSKLENYGTLARLDVEGLEAGARVSVEGKRNITDFAVWKFSPGDAKRDMEWDSPWGVGFPGWHLECSVIARETLGDQIDIHTGGIDHIPVHQTNEIAQTEAVTNKQFSQFWVHNNHLKVDGTKISKSLGNIYTLQDIVDKGYSIDAFRVFALGKHYRTEGNFTWKNLEAAKNVLQNWREAGAAVYQPGVYGSTYYSTGEIEGDTAHLLAFLQNDLDTVKLKAQIDETVYHFVNGERNRENISAMIEFLKTVEKLTGLKLTTEDITAEQKTIIIEREKARADKNWAASDRLRDELTASGVGLRDTPAGSTWYRL